jgi:hypothetical protein
MLPLRHKNGGKDNEEFLVALLEELMAGGCP